MKGEKRQNKGPPGASPGGLRRCIAQGTKKGKNMLKKILAFAIAAAFLSYGMPLVGQDDWGAPDEGEGPGVNEAEEPRAEEKVEEKKEAAEKAPAAKPKTQKPLKLRRATVKETDAEKSTVTVTVKVRKKGQKKPERKDIVLALNDDTAIKLGKKDVKLDEVKAGDSADVDYVVENGEDGEKNIASKIVLRRKAAKKPKVKKAPKKAKKKDADEGEGGGADW
jgi:hypothetical protein